MGVHSQKTNIAAVARTSALGGQKVRQDASTFLLLKKVDIGDIPKARMTLFEAVELDFEKNLVFHHLWDFQ